jgi:MFS transporter, PAT family, beta-lactamase induction signal transducer AmpG
MPHPSPWRWIPSLYFGQGIPYVVVMTLAVVMYKNLGVGNADIALLTSWLYLPWVIKPLWSPLVDLLGKKRAWVVGMQLLIGAALACVALTLPGPRFLAYSLAVFWLMAFASATHDIAADGFYMLALPGEREQAAYVGVRSLFYRLAMLGGQGGLVWLAGWLHARDGSFVNAWVAVMGTLAVLFVGLALYHWLALPRPLADHSTRTLGPAGAGLGTEPSSGPTLGASAPGAGAAAVRPTAAYLAAEFGRVFAAFFRRDDIVRVLVLLLLYRFAEAQLLKLMAPFLLDPLAKGGLGLSTQQLGIAYGTFGVAALTVGGLLGGWVISKVGLRTAIWPLVLAMHVPNLLFVLLAAWQPQQLAWVSAAIALEQFGYGFGFTAYMVFMLHVAGRSGSASGGDNPHKTAHYAICTGFMALGMMLPGMWSGWLQERLGYTTFFMWCCVATLPSFLAVAWVYRGLEKKR